MKKCVCALALALCASLAWAEDWNLVRVPTPKKSEELASIGFKLFHRAGDFWIGGLPKNSPLPSGGQILEQYNPQAGDVYRLLIPSSNEVEKLVGLVTIFYQDEDEVIIQATLSQLKTLPVIRAEWIRITLTPKPMEYSGIEIPQTDYFHPFVQEIVNQVSQTQYTQYVQSLQDFITRNTRTTNCDNAAAWILSQFQSFGLNAYYDPFQLSGMTKRNVIGEWLGLVYPDSIIFITGHYDATAGSPGTPEPNAPGADDNGSGTACVIECARILSQYNFEKTIRFVAFAGEEQGLVGSEDYVANLIAANAHVVGSFNWDMIAWSGSDPLPFDLVIYSDNNPRSQAMANKIAEAVPMFVPGTLEPLINISPGMSGSDHAPFWDVGWPATCGIEEEAWGPDFNPYYHSVNDLVANCDFVYATNCTRTAIAALADYAIPIVGTGPYLTVQNSVFDDIGGNNNGAPDPGETISIEVTLINAGNQPAQGISATLSTNDPYLTITQNNATFPDLTPQQTGTGSPAYILNISSSCPQATWVTTSLHITASGGYDDTTTINFLVGNPVYDPMGPDAYGYSAYDIYDEQGPDFNWVEIDPGIGGPGTLINYTADDQTVQVNLPFTFKYYGQNYTQISVCNNGWIAMGSTTETDYTNSAIPNSDGPAAMIAPFWHDLSPQVLGRVAYYYHASQHYFVIEYDSVRHYSPTTARETFEVILYDPAYYPTLTGDGKILFQYNQVSEAASNTVGIENQAETVGLQVLYNGDLNNHMGPLQVGMAYLFSTPTTAANVAITLTPYGTPIQIPASGGSFNYNIAIANNGSSPVTADVWTMVTLPNGSLYGPVLGPVNLTMPPGFSINRNRTQSIPAGAPTGNYLYRGYLGVYPNVIWDQDSFPFVKLPGSESIITRNHPQSANGWENYGESFEIE